MSDLFMHSMAEFAPLILQCFSHARVKTVMESVAESGGLSQCLADYCAEAGGELTIAGSVPDGEFEALVEGKPHVRHFAQPSLDVLKQLSAVDAWVFDGDHNYYTVINELRHAHTLAQAEGKPFLAFVHSTSWPCGRRDFYYAPDRIPAEFCQPHSFDAGVTLSDPACKPGRGLRGKGRFAVALEEGGPKNGVLTAIEDFLFETEKDGQPLIFANIPAVFGLGVVFEGDAEWTEDVVALLLPFHENELVLSLELNRLTNYLAVIELQDILSDA